MIVLISGASPFAGEWPQWRGPHMDGSAPGTNLPAAIDPAKNIRWATTLPGPGYSTPVIAGGRVFLTSQQRGTDNYVGLCLDAHTGTLLWQEVIGSDPRKSPRNILATPSPVVGGESVFFLFGNGDLAAMHTAGKQQWRRRLEEDYDVFSLKYGFSSSPLLHDNKLYIPVLRRAEAWREPRNKAPNESLLLCIDGDTGQTLFKHIRKTDALDETQDAYSTPIPFTHAGRTEILLIGADYVTSHDAGTGCEFWRYGFAGKKNPRWRHIPSVVTGDGTVFGVRSRSSGLFALRPQGKGDPTEQDVLWTFDGPTPDSPTPLYYEGLLYVLAGQKKTLICLDPGTGQSLWQGRLDSSSAFYASLTGADGKLYALSEEGQLFCCRAGRAGFDVLGHHRFNEKPTMATVAVANDRLYIRTAKKLYCVAK